jgi:hypothetical protein
MKLQHESGKLLYPGELNIDENSRKGSKEWIEANPIDLNTYENIEYWETYHSVYKYNFIIETAIKYNCKNLVEFGTYVGDCPLYVHDKFDKIYTIEPVLEYYNDSKRKLSKFNNIFLYNKKSLEFIKEDLSSIDFNNRTLFWVDDHVQPPYTNNASNDLSEVLNLIINSNIKNYVLLIDDYRLWNQWCDYNHIISFLENKSSELYEKVDIVTFVP